MDVKSWAVQTLAGSGKSGGVWETIGGSTRLLDAMA